MGVIYAILFRRIVIGYDTIQIYTFIPPIGCIVFPSFDPVHQFGVILKIERDKFFHMPIFIGDMSWIFISSYLHMYTFC